MPDRPRSEPMERIRLKIVLKVFLKWFQEEPFWWTTLLSCILIIFVSQVVEIYLLFSAGNIETFIKAYLVGWIALGAGCVPLIRLFGRYLA